MSGLAKRVVSTGVKRCVNGLHMGWASIGLATAVFMGMGIGAAPGQAVAQSYDWVVNANDLGSDPMVAGGYVNYNITVNNNVTQASQGAAPPTTIELSVPEDADLSEVPETSCTVGGSAAVFPVDGPATVVCDIPALAVDETFNLTAVVKSKVDGAIVLSGIVPTGDDFDPDNNDFSETTTILNGADVAIAVTGPDTALSGETVSYTYTVANAGPDTATGVVVEIPAMEGINLTNLPGYCSVSGGGFVCTLPQTISAEDSFEFSIGGQITTSGNGSSLVAAGSVSVDSPVDPLTDDNTDSQSTVLNEGSDVYLSKSNSGPGTILIDDEIVFTLSPGFTGDIPAGLQIVDVIPSTYEIGEIQVLSGGWDCEVSGQTVTCTRTSDGLTSGSNVALGDILINATAVSEGSATNTAEISSTGPTDPNPNNNTASDGGRVIEEASVSLTASKDGPSPALVVQGQEYDFTLSAQNTGNADFYGTVTMTDNLPAGMTYQGFEGNGWSCPAQVGTPGEVSITCTYEYAADGNGPLSPNARTPNLVITALATATGTLTNEATVEWGEDGESSSSSYSVDSSTQGASADLRVIKTAAEASLSAGDIQTFSIEVINAGPATSAGVTVTDTLSNLINNSVGATDAGFVSVTAPAGASCSTAASGGRGRQLSCTFDTLAVCTAGSCPTIEVQVRPGANAGELSNTAQVLSQSVADPDLTNNSSTVTYEMVARADVTVTKSATPEVAVAGENLSYFVTAQNASNSIRLSTAQNVTVTDTLPDNLIFVSATPPGGASCSQVPAAGSVTGAGNNQVICNLGNIGSGGQKVVEIVVRPTEALVGTTLTNTASVTTTTDETDTTNNSAQLETTVTEPRYDLQVNKSDSIDPVAVGEDVTYTVTIRNNGPAAAENVTMNDLMPVSNLSYQSHEPGDGVCSAPQPGDVGGTLSCTFANIDAGQAKVVTIVARGVSKGTTSNNANLKSPGLAAGYDRLGANNEVTESTTVRTRADVEVVSKVADPSTVNLREGFNFIITVRNNSGTVNGVQLAEADNVEVTDSLPANMELTGTPSVTSGTGSVTLSSCTGAAGETSFSCNLGTFDSGGVVEITVPVKVTATTSNPQTITNSAEISTSSMDVDPDNNENSGPVDVVSSSVSGTVFRDFDNDVELDSEDSGLSGVTVTLTGTAFDGTSVNVQTTTDGNGAYSFDNLPEGTYSVTRGDVSESYLVDGGSSAGTAGGTATSAVLISSIDLPAQTDATDNDFGLVPQARIGIAKTLSAGPEINDDGSFDISFDFVVENFSLEALDNITVADTLDGGAPLFGTYASEIAEGATGYGTYTISQAPGGSCSGLNTGFTGSGTAIDLVSGGSLAAGASCTITVSLQVQPTRPLPSAQSGGELYDNQAEVSGEGTLTGQTPATNEMLTDLSDDGTDPDANGNGRGDDSGEDDPTPVTPSYGASIELVKTATTDFSDPPVPGDTITYYFEITNTGDQTLTNITLTDTLVEDTLEGGPIVSLAPDAVDTDTFSATYVLTQADIDKGEVLNRATVTGTDTFGNEVTDDSITSQGADSPTNVPADQVAEIVLVKTADDSGVQSPAEVGDIITYSFAVTNTGNVTLTNVTLSDILDGIDFSSSAATSIPTLLPGETDSTTFSATYALTQADIDAGEVVNVATATAQDPDDEDVTDTSGTDTDNDTPTVVALDQDPSIELIKTVDNSQLSETSGEVGQPLTYTFEVTNTGNVTLTDVTITDLLDGLVLSGGPIASLAPGDTDDTTYTGEYLLVQADIDRGEVENTATVEGTYGEDETTGDPLTVTDEDTAIAETVFIEAVSEDPFVFDTDGGTTTSMLASDLLGTDPATLDNVTITVVETDPELTLDTSTGLITLSEGNPAGTYEVTYEICRIDNPTVCDQAVETVIQQPISGIEAVKTQELTDNGDGVDGVGDLMTYTITVENLGNTVINDVALSDTFVTLSSGATLALDSGPTFVSASEGSAEGTLEMGEVATYTATFELTIEAVDDGGLSNQITATAMPEYPDEFTENPSEVSDLSDDGDDSDGNTEDDPTVYPLEPLLYDSGLILQKTTPRGVVERGSVVPYTITVTNENPRTSGTMDLMDVLPSDFVYVDGSATWDGEPIDVTVQGKVVTWPEITVPPLTTLEATLAARVLTSADVGDHVNRARLRDSTTREPLSPEATATVTITPEPVFDCGDVYGKVFNDLNRDGYQNGPISLIVDDDAIYGGKYGGKLAAPAREEREIVENGIPAVRLTGVDGTVITTDQYGRYHVPCAMLPEDRGSNFILKLDTRSLPTGYRLTTENPRVVRLTPGKMTELNFGAALTRVVRVDLNAKGFVQSGQGAELSPALSQALSALVDQIAGEPVHLRLAYHLPDDASTADKRQARRLMRLVEHEIRDLWAEPGRVKLTIEKTIVRVEK